MEKVIRNGIVKMDWDADLFFESNSGFYAAVHEYTAEDGSIVPVVFQENQIYILYDVEEDKVASTEDVCDAIKTCFKNKMDVDEAYEENYVELGLTFVDDEEIAFNFGLSSEQVEDINDRINDIGNYWEISEVDMGE